MIDLMSLWCEVANESATWCCTSADRDIKTVAVRVEKEGERFLTVSLPKFGKAFERALELGSVTPSHFSGFRCRGGFPMFLSGFLAQIFDTDGSLLDEPSIDCILAVRQLSLMFGKIESPSSDAMVADAMRQFVQIEAELKQVDPVDFEEYLPLFQKVSTFLWADIFADVENKLLGVSQLAHDWLALEGSHEPSDDSADYGRLGADVFMRSLPASLRGSGRHSVVLGDCEIVDPASADFLVPQHGPGATADRLRGNAKFSIRQWPLRLESEFPYGDYALPSWRSYYQLDRVEFLESGAEVPVKVITVPKTPSKPRVIAIEPTGMQYIQQAISHSIVDAIENHSKATPSWRGQRCDFGGLFVGFKEQDPNRVLAREGSINGLLATLDLSEASDRVLNRHVELLFARNPALGRAIQACRSLKADVLGHGVIPLVKFASMGSALCFPVEAMVFTSIVFAAIAYERRGPVTRHLFREMEGKVRVYGDDIVVPVEYVPRVIQFLQAFGLVVNTDKSFWTGKFRESCGGDYYSGEWVTPIRLRKRLPQSLADVDEVVGLVAFRNLLYWGGYWETVKKLDERLVVLSKGDWSIVDQTAGDLGRESVLPYQAERFHPYTHVPLVRGMRVRSTTPESPITGEGALLKFLFRRSYLPFQDPKHLERQGRPAAVGIKRGWIRPY